MNFKKRIEMIEVKILPKPNFWGMGVVVYHDEKEAKEIMKKRVEAGYRGGFILLPDYAKGEAD